MYIRLLFRDIEVKSKSNAKLIQSTIFREWRNEKEGLEYYHFTYQVFKSYLTRKPMCVHSILKLRTK